MAPTDSPSLLARLRQVSPDRTLAIKGMSFGLVGVVNALVDFGFFSLGYYVLHLPIIAANIASWVIAVTGSYIMNAMITFAAETGRTLSLRAYVSFALAQSGGLVANTATVYIASHFMPVLAGKVLAVGASFVVNFSLAHLFVFRRPPAA
jgi:putative flippase GtrA